MYKTVRQGDASLQYTILPQVDQFYVNEMSSVKGAVHCPLDKRFRERMTRRVWLSSLIVAMFICCAMCAYLFDEVVSRRWAIKALKVPLTNGYLKVDDIIRHNEGNEDSTATATTTESRLLSTLETSGVLKETSSLSSRISTSSSIILEKDPSTIEFAMTETPQPSAPEALSTSFSSSEADTSPSSAELGSPVPEDPTDSRASIINPAPTNSMANVLDRLKMLKTKPLKLTRITDTVPQMYLNAGIASYKKGKITTTVLAQGLTLEGLIFKTPDGTVNPWHEKWPFDQEKTDTVHRKRTFSLNLQPLALSIWLVMLLVLLVVVLRLVRSSIERRHNCEEIETENQDEAHSTLLDTQSRNSEDKE